jgi:hypothetical protein
VQSRRVQSGAQRRPAAVPIRSRINSEDVAELMFVRGARL